MNKVQEIKPVRRVVGKYPPTVTYVWFGAVNKVWYVFMHDAHYIYNGLKDLSQHITNGSRVCFKFSPDGNSAWGHDDKGAWVGVFMRAEDAK